MTPGDQSYYSTVQNAAFFPSRAVRRGDLFIGLTHLDDLDAAVLLEIPADVYLAETERFFSSISCPFVRTNL